MRSDGVLRFQIGRSGVEQRKYLAPAALNERVAFRFPFTAEYPCRSQMTLEVFIKSLSIGRAMKALDESVSKAVHCGDNHHDRRVAIFANDLRGTLERVGIGDGSATKLEDLEVRNHGTRGEVKIQIGF